MNFLLKKTRGFSLVELMTVVAIIGILAAVAIPAFIRYVRTSKTVEAVGNLRKIYDSEATYYNSDFFSRSGVKLVNEFIAASATPSAIPAGVKSLGNWDQAAWVALQFAQDSPVMYSYSTTTSGTGISCSNRASVSNAVEVRSLALFHAVSRWEAVIIHTRSGVLQSMARDRYGRWYKRRRRNKAIDRRHIGETPSPCLA